MVDVQLLEELDVDKLIIYSLLRATNNTDNYVIFHRNVMVAFEVLKGRVRERFDYQESAEDWSEKALEEAEEEAEEYESDEEDYNFILYSHLMGKIIRKMEDLNMTNLRQVTGIRA